MHLYGKIVYNILHIVHIDAHFRSIFRNYGDMTPLCSMNHRIWLFRLASYLISDFLRFYLNKGSRITTTEQRSIAMDVYPELLRER